MRILHLASEYPPAKVFGLGRFVHGLARAQAAQGDKVQVLTNSAGGVEDDVVLEGVEVHRIAFPNPPRPPDGQGEVLQFNHCLLARFLERRARFRDVDVIVSHDWLTALAAREIVRLLGKPLVVTFHDEVNGKHFGRLSPEAAFIRDVEALTAHDASHVIANSRFIAQEIARHYAVPKDRLSAVPGGIDPRLLDVAAPQRIEGFRSVLAGPEDALALYVGRLDPEKGLDALAEATLRAMERCPRLKLAIAGSGRAEAALRETLDPLKGRVRFLGYVSGEVLALVYRSADVVVVPSTYEPFGLVALEAMIAGATVVASRTGGLPEIVDDGRTGLLVAPGEASALGDAMVRLAEDPGERRRLAAEGKARAERNFSWAEGASRTKPAYERAIANPRPLRDHRPSWPTAKRLAAPTDTSSKPLPASIVLVAYNGLSFTKKALEAILANTEPPYELILIDNGSADGTRAVFHDLGRHVGRSIAIQVLENGENLGYPKAANQGMRAARGRHVVLLNNDTEVRPGWLKALLEAAESEPRVGVVTAMILNFDGGVQSAGGVIHHPDGRFTIPHAGEDHLAPTVTARRRVENAGGPCMLVTREFLERVGVFDEAFTPGYFEDSDLCFRAREAGFSLVYEPRAEVFHHGKATSNEVAREGRIDIWRRFEANKGRFYGRWGKRLEADERERLETEEARRLPRLRILLCYHKSETTTAAYCEAALRREHDVVTAGRGQDLDLGEDATALELVEAAGGGMDVLLVIEGEDYEPRELRSAPCTTASWAIDSHVRKTAHPEGLFLRAREYDLVFTAQRDYAQRFLAQGVAPIWLPLACDPEIHGSAGTHDERDLDIVFIGHVRPFHERRRRLLDRLKARFRVTELQGVFREEMAKLYARAKIVFNCSLAGDLNMRVFEALASGALLVTDRIENGLPDLFADGEHLALYTDATLEDVVARYLADRAACEAIGARGQRLVLRHHTYAHRMRELVRMVASARPSRLRAVEASA